MNFSVNDYGGGELHFQSSRVTLDSLNLTISLISNDLPKLRTLTVNLSGVSLIDSGGVTTLLQLAKIMDQHCGAKVILSDASECIVHLLHRSHLDSFFSFVKSNNPLEKGVLNG